MTTNNKSAGKLTNKIALVTGGGGGIGRETALAYAAEGAKVAVVDINAEAAQKVTDEVKAAGGDAISITADLSKDQEVSAMIANIVSHYGRLDIAFNNAAIEIEKDPIDKISEEMFDQLMDINVKGLWLCLKYEIEQMLKQGDGGSIVNTSSIGGLGAAPRQAIYGATKHAVLGMTRSAAVEYARKGIRVNAVCPGVIRTAMTERALEREPKRSKWIEKMHPIGRLGEAEEIAKAVLFLSSDDASFIVGVALPVDGGYTAS